MQQPVRRSARGCDPNHRVQQRTSVHEASRRNSVAGQLDRDVRRPRGGRQFGLGVLRWDQAVSYCREAQALDRYRHGAGGELTGARPNARASDAFQFVEFLPGDRLTLVCADGLPDVLDGHLPSVQFSGAHRTAVQQDRRLVDPSQRHQRRGRGLVAPNQTDQCVEVMSVHH